ncbi:MAG: acyltransferase family protein [Chloroflexi bacterium]|nr:acyltransferase family protein [Chloroflexota bacterium]OJV90063.1 MAG: hypothetical protein BGO39_01400 [Chloroflexi bacterium 54-19]
MAINNKEGKKANRTKLQISTSRQLLAEEPLYQADEIRRYDLDWVRVLVVLMLIPFHAALIYLDDEPFYIKNGELSIIFDEPVSFLNSWGMQLLFVVAGAACWFSLKNARAGQFIKKKLLRLLLPLLFGILVIVPPMPYLALLNHSPYQGTYWDYYPHFFDFDPEDFKGYNGHFTPSHLWFVVFLFVLSLIALPLFSWFKKERGQQFISWLANLCEKPGVIFLGALPLLLTDGFPDLGDDTQNPLKCLVLMILGYVLMSNPRFQQALDRQKFLSLLLAIAASVTFIMIRQWGLSQPSFSLGSTIYDVVHDFNLWAIVLTLFGLGHSYFNNPGKAWQYLNEASYPVYILHLTIIVFIGFYVVQLEMILVLKFLMTVLGSFAATFGVYELVVRRSNLARRLLGMKLLQQHTK